MNLLLALGGSVVGAGSFILLMQNATGDCSSMLNLLYCAAFIPGCVAGASGWKSIFAKK